ncbi:MAG: GNAT family N-acetyltransferase [Candidatus Jordarchaeaceae archaeon]
MPTILRGLYIKRKVFFFEKLLPDPCFRTDSRLDITVKILRSDEFLKISKKFENFSELEAKRRLRAGHISFGAKLSGEFIHLTWISFDEAYVGSLERKIRVYPNSAYIYDTYTIPEYRGLGIAPKVMHEALHYLYKTKKIRTAYMAISQDNFPSLRTAQKETFRKIGAITYTRIYKLKLYRFKGETREDYNKLRAMFPY